MADIIKISPIVFAVGNEYQIFVPVTDSTVMWTKVGEECYYDHSNGVLRSAVTVHKMTVPMAALDREKKYSICYRKVFERKPYFSDLSEIEEEIFEFSPLPDENYTIYHISDTHGMVDSPVASAKNFEKEFGKIDLLILNGDIIDHSGDLKNFEAIYKIASLITNGSIPVVFSRGNHDTRGIFAECIADYTPTRNGISYFSFKLGSLWGLVLDCGEDKADTNKEYGNTICCHAFRRDETRYIESLIENAKSEYASSDIKRKLVIVHAPFTKIYSAPFDIETDTYKYWTKLLRENIRPCLIIGGHTHKLNVSYPGDERDDHGQPCPVVVASEPNRKENSFTGGGFIFKDGKCELVFASVEEIKRKETIIGDI